MTIKSPHIDEDTAPAAELPPRIRSTAPVAPAAIPIIFFPVIGSFRKNAARTIAHNGMLVVIMDAFVGDVIPRPVMKHP